MKEIEVPELVFSKRKLKSPRQWAVIKRREFNAVLKAVDKFRMGCAYTPVYPHNVSALETVLEDMRRELSPLNWKVVRMKSRAVSK